MVLVIVIWQIVIKTQPGYTMDYVRIVMHNCQTLNCCHKIDYGKYCEDCKFDRAYLRGE